MPVTCSNKNTKRPICQELSPRLNVITSALHDGFAEDHTLVTMLCKLMFYL